MPPDYDDGVIYAIRAFKEGKANEGQQQHLWRWLSYVCAADDYQDLSFRPGGEEGRRATDFAEGKRFVFQQIKKLLNPTYTPKKPTPKPTIAQKRLRGGKTNEQA